MTRQHRLKIIMLVVMLSTLNPARALAEGEPRLTLSGGTLPVTVGQEVVVALRVEDVSSVIKAEAHLTFDPTALAVVALDHGDFLSPNLKTDALIWQNDFDNQAGTIDYGVLLKPSQPAAGGNGLLATITFQVRTGGPTVIEIQEGRFFSPDGVELIALTDRVQFTVSDGAAADSAPAVQEQPAPVGSVVQEASAPITPPVQKQSAPDQTARTDNYSSMTESAPAVQEQPLPAGSAKGTEAETIIEPERVEQIREPSLRPRRRFNVQTQSDPGDNRLLALLLVVGLGLVVLFIDLVGFVALASAWFWLIRSRRRHSLGRIQ